jgi:hypothetical protein
MSPRVGLDAVVERKFLTSLRLELRPLARSGDIIPIALQWLLIFLKGLSKTWKTSLRIADFSVEI